MKVSIIIVHYKVKNYLFQCLESLEKEVKGTNGEVIVINNDDDKSLETKTKQKYPWVQFVQANKNSGYGGGNNIGAYLAKGEYLFFLNPDTLVLARCIKKLSSFLDKNQSAGVAAPLLLDKDKVAFPQQGALVLTPLKAVIVLSFLNKLFPNNPISKKYFLSDWDKTTVRETDVVPGTAFMIRRELFQKAGMFDEHFFLFFEEHDLCKRVQGLGYKIYIYPKAKIIHIGGQSTKYSHDTYSIFVKSRFLYFSKHFGLPKAILVELFLRIKKLFFLLT